MISYKAVQKSMAAFSKWAFRLDRTGQKLPEGPCLMIANHASFLDPLILCASFERKICFVADAHVFSNPVKRFLLKKAGTIPCRKGGTACDYLFRIRDSLREKKTVCIFAEGNITYDGVTGHIVPETGRLLKLMQVPVAVVRIEGSYFIKPRWSRTIHRGNVRCSVTDVLSVEDLNKLPQDRINCRIEAHLYTDAVKYALQTGTYTGLRAEGIQNILQICPVCKRIGTVKGKETIIRCICGANTRISGQGIISGGDFPFDTIAEWNKWQCREIRRRFEKGTLEPFTDNHTRLIERGEHYRNKKTDAGTLKMDGRGLSCGNTQFSFSDIIGMDTRNKGILVFQAKGIYYEIRSVKGYKGVLYKERFYLEKMKFCKKEIR